MPCPVPSARCQRTCRIYLWVLMTYRRLTFFFEHRFQHRLGQAQVGHDLLELAVFFFTTCFCPCGAFILPNFSATKRVWRGECADGHGHLLFILLTVKYWRPAL
jgi:hypothetical protein